MQQLQYVKQYVKEYVACRMQAIPLFNRAGKTYFEQTFTVKTHLKIISTLQKSELNFHIYLSIIQRVW